MGHDGWRRIRAAGGTAAVTLGLMAGVAAANPPHITVGAYPTCSKTALRAGLSRGFARLRGVTSLGPAFGCRHAWAYAEVTAKGITVTSVFHARHGRWVTVRRRPACSKHAIPRRIYRPACETS